MADKEEVEPTDESAATESSDAAADPTASAAVTGSSGRARAAGAGGPDGDEVEDADDDRFDEIVRDSGIGESDDDNDDNDDDEVEKALEPAGVAATAAAGSSTLAARKAGREAKGMATKKRDQPVKHERTGPVKFVRESVGELRKVVYPTGQQLINYFIVVLVFVLFVIGYVSLLDLGMGWAIFKVFS